MRQVTDYMKVSILVLGKGSNLRQIFQAIESGKLPGLWVSHVIADRDCGAIEEDLDRGGGWDISTFFFLSVVLNLSSEIDELLIAQIDLIVLAGFLSILGEDFYRRC
ncbi:MAG: hypothetical protein ACMUEM_07645 [Flavobacteriales bacterium AspAUS03]